MVEVNPGQYNDLEMVKFTDFGIYLDGGEFGEILMPAKYVPFGTNAGDKVNCFVYYDTDDRLIATTEKPFATVNEFACLKCVAVSSFGAFLYWGLLKDILVPFREQNMPLEEGKYYVVFIYLDNSSKRIVASSKIDKFLDKTPGDFKENQKVDLMIARKTEVGFVAVINKTHTGLIYKNEVFKTIRVGDELTGYIKQVRADGKIDLTLQLPGYDALLDENDRVLNVIKSNGGFMAVTDKSQPEEIYKLFNLSKKNWKKIIGTLYKKGKILLEEGGIRLNMGDD